MVEAFGTCGDRAPTRGIDSIAVCGTHSGCYNVGSTRQLVHLADRYHCDKSPMFVRQRNKTGACSTSTLPPTCHSHSPTLKPLVLHKQVDRYIINIHSRFFLDEEKLRNRNSLSVRVFPRSDRLRHPEPGLVWYLHHQSNEYEINDLSSKKAILVHPHPRLSPTSMVIRASRPWRPRKLELPQNPARPHLIRSRGPTCGEDRALSRPRPIFNSCAKVPRASRSFRYRSHRGPISFSAGIKSPYRPTLTHSAIHPLILLYFSFPALLIAHSKQHA